MEIRINIGNAYRIFYVAKFEEGIKVSMSCMLFRKKRSAHRGKIFNLASNDTECC